MIEADPPATARRLAAYVASRERLTTRSRHGPFRPGDVRHSKTGVGPAHAGFGYGPEVVQACGLARAAGWFLRARGWAA